MAILIVGLILFLGIHSVKIAAPALRNRGVARFGEGPYKGLHALASLGGILLIVWGFEKAANQSAVLYAAPDGFRHVTAALMLPALILFVASVLPAGRIKRAVRHPLLLATMLWAFAHLIVNGDLAGVILFGAFLAWAFVDLLAQPGRPPPVASSAQSDMIAVAVGTGLYLLLAWRLHAWLFGAAPFV